MEVQGPLARKQVRILRGMCCGRCPSASLLLNCVCHTELPASLLTCSTQKAIPLLPTCPGLCPAGHPALCLSSYLFPRLSPQPEVGSGLFLVLHSLSLRKASFSNSGSWEGVGWQHRNNE